MLPMKRAAERVRAHLISFIMPIIDVICRKEERALTAEIEKWILSGEILYISFSYPKDYPAAKPCPERVVFKGDRWRAVYLENGMKLLGHAPPEISDLLQRLGQEHILNLQNLLRFVCDHCRSVRAEASAFDASSQIVGYVHPKEMSTERSALQRTAEQGFDLDFRWEVVKIVPASGPETSTEERHPKPLRGLAADALRVSNPERVLLGEQR
jgi:hypothetical protein